MLDIIITKFCNSRFSDTRIESIQQIMHRHIDLITSKKTSYKRLLSKGIKNSEYTIIFSCSFPNDHSTFSFLAMSTKIRNLHSPQLHNA